MCNVLWTYGISYDDYGVAYNENYEELLYFPKSFSHPYYKVIEGCKKISNRTFKEYLYTNSCSGVEFIKRNYPICLESISNKFYIAGKMGHTYLAKGVYEYIKEEMCLGKSLLRVVSSLVYVSLYDKDTNHHIPYLISQSLYTPLCAIELPRSLSTIGENAIKILNHLNLVIVPEGMSVFYRKLLGANAAIVEEQELNYKDVFSSYPTYYVNSNLLNWTQYKSKYSCRKNKYIEDITILKHIESKYIYPIILFPNNLKRQLNKKLKEESFIPKEVMVDLIMNDINVCSTLWKSLCKTVDKIVKDDRHLQHGDYEYDIYIDLKYEFPNSVYREYRKGKYQPDIIINLNNEIFIDIEIDEPYTADTYNPIHYIGSADEERNAYFVSNNWTVVRFAHEQLIRNGNYHHCVNIIVAIVQFLKTGETSHLLPIFSLRRSLKEVPRWTKEESEKMAELDLRQWGYVWNIEEEIKKLEEWRLEQENLPREPEKSEPEPDIGFATPNEWFT